MPLPTSSHIVLVGGASSNNSTIFTSSLIQIGDVIKITGSGGNDGIFTVEQIVDSLNSGEALGSSFDQANCSVSGTTVTHSANASIVAGLSVTGTGIAGGSSIVSIDSTTQFTLNRAGSTGTVTLTFADQDIYYIVKGRPIITDSTGGNPTIKVVRPTGDKLIALGDTADAGGVDVWSNNATSNYTSENNGWEQAAINPTISGENAKYMYLYVDGALRVRNINTANKSLVKWYGYIQRNQFNINTGLIFAEWQEHINTLSSPKLATNLTYAYGHSAHDADTGGAGANYFKNPATDDFRGVAIHKYAENEVLQLASNIQPSTTSLRFEDSSTNDKTGRAVVGEVISIKDVASGVGDLGEYPKEFLFCKRGYTSSSGFAIYERSYGGALPDGTAPFDYSDNDTPIIERGTGFNFGVTTVSGSGEWGEGTYEFHQTFVYDGNQESLPVRTGDGASSIDVFSLSVNSGDGLRISIFADLAYSGRITGGRIYIRPLNSDEDLIMLVDIDIVKGVRTTLDGDHQPWSYQEGKGYYVLGESTGNALSPNLDTYQTINGFSPDVKFLGIGGFNEGYKAGVIANRRTFVANVSLKGSSGEVETFGDRIMYSEINKFDTFLPHNFIDVSTGDYGEYVALESYADRLLAFKHNLIHIINIASPSVFNWYLEETVKYYGVEFPFSVAKTNNGIAWVSDDGCYLYDGSRIRNLIDKKIAVSNASYTTNNITWNDWYRGSAFVKDIMLGYDPISNSLIMVRSPNDSSTNSNQAFVYDFDSNGWTFSTGIFDDSETYTNFITDFNNNLTVGYQDDSTDVDFKKFLPVPITQTDQEFVTRDIDFGVPGLIKKIYKVIVTYKSNASETTPFKYAINGTQNFSGDGGGTFTGNFVGTSDKWDVVTLSTTSPIECQSLQIKFDAPSTGLFEINDMTVQYRVIGSKEVT